MNFQRILAIIERDMRKFFRSPALMMASMIFPLTQLVVLGYAFGGKIKDIPVAVVDQDHTSASRDVRGRFLAIAQGPGTIRVVDYSSVSDAVLDLRSGFVRAVVYIRGYSQRVQREPAAHRLHRGQHRQFSSPASPQPYAVSGAGHQSA
jgi:ABC-2 type transport system permease protein